MGSAELKKEARLRRKERIRKTVKGTEERPRLSIFRSSKHIYAQIIDDNRGHTLVSAASTEKVMREHPKFESKVAMSVYLGKLIAQRAIEKGIRKVVFDRGGFLYHGRVKAVSDGAREAGLDF